MSAEDISSRFRYLYPRQTVDIKPTPLQIQNYIHKMKSFASLMEEIDNHVPASVVRKAVFYRNALVYYKFTRFRASVERIVENYGQKALLLVDEACVKKNGSINEKKLRKRLDR